MFNSKRRAKRITGLLYPAEETNLEEVASMINETEKDLSFALQGYQTPKDWLAFLEGYLSAPERILVGINLVSRRLDWRNVLTGEQDEKAGTVTFARCSLREDVIRHTFLISYSKSRRKAPEGPSDAGALSASLHGYAIPSVMG